MGSVVNLKVLSSSRFVTELAKSTPSVTELAKLLQIAAGNTEDELSPMYIGQAVYIANDLFMCGNIIGSIATIIQEETNE